MATEAHELQPSDREESREDNVKESLGAVAIKLVPAEGWKKLANCRGMDPELFFPGRGAPTRDAKAVCQACSVRQPCLEEGLNTRERWGIWGGFSERERRRMRRRINAGQEVSVVASEAVRWGNNKPARQ